MEKTLLIMACVTEIFALCIYRIFAERVMESRNRNKPQEFAAWIIYFFVYNYITYFVSGNALINLIAFIVCSFALLTCLYQDSVKHRIYVIVLLYMAGMCSELMVYSVFYFVRQYREDFLLGSIVSKLIWFCLLKLLLLFMKKGRKAGSTLLDWLEAVFVPIGCIIVFFIFLPTDKILPDNIVLKQASKVLGIAILLIINIASYYLYEKGKEMAGKQMLAESLQEQCNYYMRQCEESKALWMELSKFRHDIKQKYMYFKILLETGQYEELSKYYEDNLAFVTGKKSVADSGNIFFDSILNYKAEIAAQNGIQFLLRLEVPYDCLVNGEEISICLGNLLDNAIEAAKEVEADRRTIFIKIKVQMHNLYVEIKNPYTGLRIKKEQEYITTKQDLRSHGWGLQIIREIVERYHGEMEINGDGNVFSVKMLLYQAVY